MEQSDLLRQLVSVLEELDLTYVLVGSIASGAYGEPRLTQDIDVVVKLPAEQVAELCEAFSGREYYISREAAQEAVRLGKQFNVIHPASGNKIDFLIAREDPWGKMQIRRRRRVRILPDLEGYTAAPEDIILSKMDYYREGGSEKHLRDITGIMKITGELIDKAYVTQWAESLGLMEVWQAILKRLGEQP